MNLLLITSGSAMDPFAAIGFAANLLQFIDYLSYILKVGEQICRNGMPEFSSNIQTSAKILEDQNISDKCVKESQDLLAFMKQFERQEFEKGVKFKIEHAVKDGPTSLVAALQIVRGKSEIENLAKRIESYRAQLHSEVLMSIRETAISMASQLDNMSISDTTRHQEIINTVGEAGSSLQDSLQLHSETLSQQLLTKSEAMRQTILGAIDSLARTIKSSYLFPTLPRSIVEYDPSLQTAAIRGGARIEEQILELLNL
ncbi:hypothetical protein QQZ08_007573 [Neonectria magnoliae]|uniref:Uncharacterized protein n=1 Tax=Neonectria magnoliae TaxID=2732573 RepID=A0ABR1HY51_9HYPO